MSQGALAVQTWEDRTQFSAAADNRRQDRERLERSRKHLRIGDSCHSDRWRRQNSKRRHLEVWERYLWEGLGVQEQETKGKLWERSLENRPVSS